MRLDQRELCKDINCEDCPFMQDTCKLLDAYAEPSKLFKEFYEQGKYDAEVERAFTEPSGDLISRADAIEVVMKHKMPFTIQQEVAREIGTLPSADRPTDESCQDCPLYDAEAKNCPRFNKVIPQTRKELLADRPKGEWVYLENEPYSKCSVCGAYIDSLDDDKYMFCPYCGADMRGDNNE